MVTGKCILFYRDASSIPVYNLSSTSVRPMVIKDYVNFLLSLRNIWPFENSIWYTSYFCTNFYIFDLAHLVFHTMPGKALDTVAVMMGKEAR